MQKEGASYCAPPRPVVVIQSYFVNQNDSVLVVLMTSTLIDANQQAPWRREMAEFRDRLHLRRMGGDKSCWAKLNGEDARHPARGAGLLRVDALALKPSVWFRRAVRAQEGLFKR